MLYFVPDLVEYEIGDFDSTTPLRLTGDLTWPGNIASGLPTVVHVHAKFGSSTLWQ